MTERPLRILYVIASLSMKHGGPSKACVEMANAMAARGHHVDIFTTDQDGTDARCDVPLGVPVRNGLVDIYYFRANILKAWPAASLALARALRDHVAEYDIVHNHSLYLFHGLAGGHYCRANKVPYLIRPCGALDPVIYKRHRPRKALFEWLFERRNFRNAAAIHFTSTDEMGHAARVIDFPNGIVVPLGLNMEDYGPARNPQALREAYPVLAGKRIVLFLSRLTYKKGLDLLIPAFAEVARAVPDAHLVLAGPDNDGYGEHVRRWVKEQGIEDRVLFTGMLQGDIKLAALHDSEFFVLPSYGENFGIAVAEAMAAGLAVQISRHVAIWQEVAQAQAGLVVENDVPHIAAAMQRLLASPAEARALGVNAKTLIKQEFSWPQVAERLEVAYRDILAKDTRKKPAELV